MRIGKRTAEEALARRGRRRSHRRGNRRRHGLRGRHGQEHGGEAERRHEDPDRRRVQRHPEPRPDAVERRRLDAGAADERLRLADRLQGRQPGRRALRLAERIRRRDRPELLVQQEPHGRHVPPAQGRQVRERRPARRRRGQVHVRPDLQAGRRHGGPDLDGGGQGQQRRQGDQPVDRPVRPDEGEHAAVREHGAVRPLDPRPEGRQAARDGEGSLRTRLAQHEHRRHRAGAVRARQLAARQPVGAEGEPELLRPEAEGRQGDLQDHPERVEPARAAQERRRRHRLRPAAQGHQGAAERLEHQRRALPEPLRGLPRHELQGQAAEQREGAPGDRLRRALQDDPLAGAPGLRAPARRARSRRGRRPTPTSTSPTTRTSTRRSSCSRRPATRTASTSRSTSPAASTRGRRPRSGFSSR